MKVRVLSPLSLIVTEFFRISSQSNACPLLDLPPSLSLWTSRRSNMSPPIIKWATTRYERRSAASRTFSIESRFSDYDEILHGLESGGGINLEISHKAPFAAVFNYAIRLAGRDDKSGGYRAGNHILRLRRTSQCRLATMLRANYVTLFTLATSFSLEILIASMGNGRR